LANYFKILAKLYPICDRCYDFKNIFAEKIGANIDVFAQSSTSFFQKIDQNIGF
jgi:hypothetical protein